MLGKRTTIFFLYGLFGVNFLITAIQIVLFTTTAPVLILCLMNIILFLIFTFRTQLAKNDLYRLIGDAVFFVPGAFTDLLANEQFRLCCTVL